MNWQVCVIKICRTVPEQRHRRDSQTNRQTDRKVKLKDLKSCKAFTIISSPSRPLAIQLVVFNELFQKVIKSY